VVVGAGVLLANRGMLLAIDHIAAGDFVFAGAHQGQLNLILDFFDMYGAARGQTTFKGVHHHFGELGNSIAHPTRTTGLLTFDS